MEKWEIHKPHINVGTMRHRSQQRTRVAALATSQLEKTVNKFQKYKSIENSYRDKFITDMLSYNPLYHTCSYVATEKIHGANFQFNFKNDVLGGIGVSFGKRSALLGSDESFYNYQAVVNKQEYKDLIHNVCTFMRNTGIDSLILYGELAGPGVQSGVEYGDQKFFKFFDMCIDDKYITPKDFYLIMDDLGASNLTVPVVAKFETLDEALSFEVEGKESIVFPKEGNVWEGVVIKPWEVIAVNKDEEQVLFYIKKKDPKFADKQKKSKDTKKDVPIELANAQHAFSEYLTDIRLQDVFSKHGMITDQKQIGEYIKHMMNDAKEDFFKDCEDLFNDVPDKHKGKVFSITGQIVSKMLFKYI